MSRKAKKQQYATVALTSLLIVGIVVGVFYAAKTAGWLAATSAPDESKITIFVKQKNNESVDLSDNLTITWYRKDATDLKESDIEALTLSDFTAFDSDSDSTGSVEYESKYIYVVKINGTGYQTLWACSNSLVANGKMLALGPGEKTFYIFKIPTVATALSYPTNRPDATTVNNTVYSEWTVNLYTIDETEKLNDKTGYAPVFDFSLNRQNYTVISVGFNTTALSSFATLDTSYTYEKSATGNVLYFYIDCDYVSGTSLKIKFSSGLNSAFAVRNITAAFGNEVSAQTMKVQA